MLLALRKNYVLVLSLAGLSVALAIGWALGRDVTLLAVALTLAVSNEMVCRWVPALVLPWFAATGVACVLAVLVWNVDRSVGVVGGFVQFGQFSNYLRRLRAGRA